MASKTSSKAIKSKSKTDTTSKSKSKTSKAEAEAEAEAPADAEPEEPDTDESDGKVIKVGKKLPKIVLKDEEGEDVEVGKLAGERGVVIFLYPKVSHGVGRRLICLGPWVDMVLVTMIVMGYMRRWSILDLEIVMGISADTYRQTHQDVRTKLVVSEMRSMRSLN